MAWEKGKPRAESTLKKMRKLDDEQRREAIRLYLSGLSTRKVADRMNCGDEAIRRILVDEGIPRRSRSEAVKLGSDTPESRKKRSKSHIGVKRKPFSKETKQKLSVEIKRKWKDPEYQKKQVEGNKIRSAKSRKNWENDVYREKVLTGVAASFEGKETSIERIVREILESLNVPFEAQYVVDRCIPDFYLPNEKKIIFTDGDYWHNIPEIKERDKRTDFFLKRLGFTVLRLTETEINNGSAPQIKEFLGINH